MNEEPKAYENQSGGSVRDPAERLERIFSAQKADFEKNPMPSAQERIAGLNALKKMLLAEKEQIAEAISADFSHRATEETYYAEIMAGVESLKHAAKHVRRWMKPSRKMPGMLYMPARAGVYYQPLGVVGVIVPWNYPLYLALGPVIGALAAGNRVIIKMSKFSQHLAEYLQPRLAGQFSEKWLTLFTGEEMPGSVFTGKPWDHLFFTGSTEVGRKVMQDAAANLTPVTLELGGKSPAIVSAAVPINDAARRIAWGKMLNSGQTCVAPDYVLCPHNRIEEFAEAFRKAVTAMYPSLQNNPDYTAVENEQQVDHLRELLADAEEKGARVVEINPAGETFADGRKMAPRLLLDVKADMLVLQKEIFGPLLPVVGYDKLEEAVAYVKQGPRPLALYYFDYNRENAEYVINHTHSGGVLVNDTMVHVPQENIPFGGVGDSGMGQYHGWYGFLNFSKAKGVLFKSKFNSGSLIYPPYSRRVHKWVQKMALK